jgi:hypothetical protein
MNPIYGLVEGRDPITLESFTETSRIVEFKYNSGSVYYDYDNLRKNVDKLSIIPHTGEKIDTSFKMNFNKICNSFNDDPVFTDIVSEQVMYEPGNGDFNFFNILLHLLGLFLYTCVVAHLLSVYNNNMKEIEEYMKN